jgi:hypothetical protein
MNAKKGLERNGVMQSVGISVANNDTTPSTVLPAGRISLNRFAWFTLGTMSPSFSGAHTCALLGPEQDVAAIGLSATANSSLRHLKPKR